MYKFLCGDFIVEIDYIKQEGMRAFYSFTVTLDGKTVAQGSDLSVPALWNDLRIANEIMCWLLSIDERTRQEWGWTVTPDQVYERAVYEDDGAEPVFDFELLED